LGVVCFLALPALAGCNRSAGDVTSQGDDAAGGDGEAAPSDDGGGGTGDAGLLGDGSTTSNCAQGADLLYVVSEERTLYTFDPKKILFSPLGSVDCAKGVGANSMAVDRDAVAWINYQDGSLWKVDTKKTPTVCQASGYTAGQQGVQLFGMGFSAKSAGSNAETLFVCDLAGGGLFFLDLSAMSLNRLGPFHGAIANRACELTGTGDARLFGLFAGSPLGDAGAAAVDQIDPGEAVGDADLLASHARHRDRLGGVVLGRRLLPVHGGPVQHERARHDGDALSPQRRQPHGGGAGHRVPRRRRRVGHVRADDADAVSPGALRSRKRRRCDRAA
jgi:hypothetical protein